MSIPNNEIRHSRLVLVTNIPSPYRLHSFTVLQHELDSRDIALEVLFMAATETGRFWQPQPDDWQFNGHIFSGLHPRWRGIDMHVNPTIWTSILKRPPTWLIIGGGWQFPTSLGLFLLHPLYRHRTHSLVWAEANHRFSTHPTGSIARARQRLLTSVDGLIIPGQIAATTVREHWGILTPPLIYWPNLVDETIYHNRVVQLRSNRDALLKRFQIPENNRVLFWSARLDEFTKGILNFLRPIAGVLDSKATLLLAGEGPDRSSVEQWIRDNPHLDIRLLGHVSQERILECLALADVFILPSMRDRNPLSLIEAMWAELPILTSVNCGNWPETVQAGVNGWLLDPASPQEIQATVQDILRRSSEELREMGKKSLEIVRRNFSSKITTQRFVESMIAAFPPRV